MIKAIVKNGVVVPRDPLPADWQEDTEVDVEKTLCTAEHHEDIDRWLAEMDAIAAQGDPEDDLRLQTAPAEHRREQKELARKKAGVIISLKTIFS